MKNKVLIVYQFATFGGVERVLLNRAEALKHFKKDYKLYIYFYEDYGAKDSIREYITRENLNDYIEVVDKLNPKEYDYIFSIDTPQIFQEKGIDMKDVYIETHTAEKKYRKYLSKCIGKVKKTIVPSKVFYDQIVEEYNVKDKSSLYVLNNFVLRDIKPLTSEKIQLPLWNKKIIFYFGRVDENKNVKETLLILKEYIEKYDDDVMALIVGKIDPEYNFEEFLEENDLLGKVVLLPPVNFERIDILLRTLKDYKTVFVSSSKGETFSLSAAEAISINMPCILSDIPAHKELLFDDDRFLYKLNNTSDCAKKLNALFKKYEEYSKDMAKYEVSLSSKMFIERWEDLLKEDK